MKLTILVALLAVLAVSARISTRVQHMSKVNTQSAAAAYRQYQRDNYDLRKYGYDHSFVQQVAKAGDVDAVKEALHISGDIAPIFSAFAAEMETSVTRGERDGYYESLNGLTNSDTFNAGTKKKLYELLAAQSGGNMRCYVSHAASHGIRVMELGQALYDALYTSEEIDSMASDHDLSKSKFKELIDTTNLLHDIGYAGQSPNDKFVHALAGSRMVDGWMRAELVEAFGRDNADALIGAIHYHNYDTHCSEGNTATDYQSDWDDCFKFKDGLWSVKKSAGEGCSPESHKAASKWSKCNQYVFERDVQGEFGTPFKLFEGVSGKSQIETRSYKPADYLEDPLIFLVRLADNLDASHRRLTPFQQTDKFMKYLYDMYQGTKQPSSNPDDCQFLVEGTDFEEISKDECEGGKFGFSGYSFLHFYSNWIIKSASFRKGDDDKTILKLDFVTDSTESDLVDDPLRFPALYQINRLAEAAQSLNLGTDDTVTSAWSVEFSGETYPLAAFNAGTIAEDNCALWKKHGEIYRNYENYERLTRADIGCAKGGPCKDELSQSRAAWVEHCKWNGSECEC